MIRLVAQKLYEEWNGVGGWSSLTDYDRRRWEFMARAAIKTLREPSASMVSAGDGGRKAGNSKWGNTRGTWVAMIDAALDNV